MKYSIFEWMRGKRKNYGESIYPCNMNGISRAYITLGDWQCINIQSLEKNTNNQTISLSK